MHPVRPCNLFPEDIVGMEEISCQSCENNSEGGKQLKELIEEAGA